MPDGEIRVSFAAVEAAGADIKSTSQKMDQELDNLRAKLAPLEAGYTGEAKELWHQIQTSWNNNQNELNQVLAQIGVAVNQAAENYRSTEKGVGGLWG
jgi:WXG100 family type VII secretion target